MVNSNNLVGHIPLNTAPDRHVIERVSYASEEIECSCGALVTAEVDELEHDRHLHLCLAWAEHRRAVGLRALSVLGIQRGSR